MNGDLAASDLAAQLERIHATPHRMVMNFAGAGAQALMWLHSVGGSSRTVLEATDRYTPASLVEAVGFTPQQFTSVRVARALAANAHTRAALLNPAVPVFGLGATATIATDRAKRGEHRCAVAVTDALGTVTYSLTLTKGLRDRAGEEELVSLVILKAVAEACGLTFPEVPVAAGETLQQTFQPVPALARLEQGETEWLVLHPDGRVQTAGDLSDPADLGAAALLSGSFNPLHDGHRDLARVAAERLERAVYFELPLLNADKAAISLAEARRRALQFAGTAPLVLSRAPLFSDKAALFPNTVFVLGADTAARLVAPRFYGGVAQRDAALAVLRRRGARFLVAGRSGKGGFETLRSLPLPADHRDLFQEIPESAFRADISSTELRERWVSAEG